MGCHHRVIHINSTPASPDRYHKRCTTASCNAEYVDKCKALREELTAEGKPDLENQVMEYQRDRKDAYFNFTEVMMCGQLGTGIIEGTRGSVRGCQHRGASTGRARLVFTPCPPYSGVWFKLKGHKKHKRTLLMLVAAFVRVGCELAQHSILNVQAVSKFSDKLHLEQNTLHGKRKDMATFTILKRCAQKLTWYVRTSPPPHTQTHPPQTTTTPIHTRHTQVRHPGDRTETDASGGDAS